MAAEHTHTHPADGNPNADVDIAEWATRFDLLSDPHRLEILIVLHRRPGIIVGELATAVGRTETAVSQALRVLRHQGWVTSTRVGRSVSYRLDDDTVHDLLHWMGAGHTQDQSAT